MAILVRSPLGTNRSSKRKTQISPPIDTIRVSTGALPIVSTPCVQLRSHQRIRCSGAWFIISPSTPSLIPAAVQAKAVNVNRNPGQAVRR